MLDSNNQNRQKSNTILAVEELKRLIFSGELSADSSHLESELALRLGMSRTPVREAALMLEAHGLLEVRPRKGIRIAAISPRDMEEIYEILTELECLAAKHAANMGYSLANLKNLAQSIDKMEKALANVDRINWAHADEEFHTELVRLGGNKRVEEVVKGYNDQVRRARNVTLNLRPLPLKSNEDHSTVYKAIMDGNPELAESAHRLHRNSAKRLIVSILKNSGLKRL